MLCLWAQEGLLRAPAADRRYSRALFFAKGGLKAGDAYDCIRNVKRSAFLCRPARKRVTK